MNHVFLFHFLSLSTGLSLSAANGQVLITFKLLPNIFWALLFTFVGPGSALYVTTDQGPSSLSLAAVSTVSWDKGRLVSHDPQRNLTLFVF